jgi:protein-S-isoprenylcysteine O-methyltransferase Ste14
MTLPLATYLIVMFTNLPVSLTVAISELFTPFFVAEKVLLIVGLVIFLYSVVHLKMKKREGLVTSGPYGLVRHPQYFGVVLSTIGLTSWSVWLLNNTRGVGFLSSSQTIAAWFIQLLAYIILANVEELFLLRNYGKAYENYINRVSFLVPLLKTRQKSLDILVSVIVLSLFLFQLIVFT